MSAQAFVLITAERKPRHAIPPPDSRASFAPSDEERARARALIEQRIDELSNGSPNFTAQYFLDNPNAVSPPTGPVTALETSALSASFSIEGKRIYIQLDPIQGKIQWLQYS